MENRRALLQLAAVSAMAGFPLGANDASLPDAVHAPSDAKLTRQPFGEERVYFEGPTVQLKSMKAGSLLLYPGREPHPPHQHPEEEFMLVTEGHGEILVDGVKHQVGPGAMMFCKGNQLHGIKNNSAAPFVFYFSKWQA